MAHMLQGQPDVAIIGVVIGERNAKRHLLFMDIDALFVVAQEILLFTIYDISAMGNLYCIRKTQQWILGFYAKNITRKVIIQQTKSSMIKSLINGLGGLCDE